MSAGVVATWGGIWAAAAPFRSPQPTAIEGVPWFRWAAWLAPPLLGRLTRSGLSPQMGVAAWLTADNVQLVYTA